VLFSLLYPFIIIIIVDFVFAMYKYWLLEVDMCFYFIITVLIIIIFGTIYSRKNKSQSKKSVTALLSNSISDCIVNIDDDNEVVSNVEVIN
jgi:cation transport ATPase